MLRRVRLPSTRELPPGARRDFVELLFGYYRLAGRPPLDLISGVAQESDFGGAASRETIRRALKQWAVPTRWRTAEAIFLALCRLASVNPGEEAWDSDSFGSSPTRLEDYRSRWNAAIDEDEAEPAPTRGGGLGGSAGRGVGRGGFGGGYGRR